MCKLLVTDFLIVGAERVQSRWKGNDQEPTQLNSTSCPKHQTGKGHQQFRHTKIKTAEVESQEKSSFLSQQLATRLS